jgi:hypothetical protein
MFTWLSLAGLLVSLGAVSLGCSGQNMKDPDNDEKKEKARPFKTTEPTKDRMDDNTGDREDWRYWTAEKDGTGEVRVEVSKWEDSTTLTAMVTVFDEAGTRLIEKPMNQSSNPKIQEQFPVENGRKYFARAAGPLRRLHGQATVRRGQVRRQAVRRRLPRRQGLRQGQERVRQGRQEA